MSGKLVVVVVAVVVSSASAATVGYVYKLVETVRSAAPASIDDVAFVPVKSAVVLNASENSVDPFAGSSVDGDAPACPNETGRHCVVEARASDIRLQILNYTVSIPLWLGGDGEEQYANGQQIVLLSSDDPLHVGFGLEGGREGATHPNSEKSASSPSTQTPDSNGDTALSSPVWSDQGPAVPAFSGPMFQNDVTVPGADWPGVDSPGGPVLGDQGGDPGEPKDPYKLPYGQHGGGWNPPQSPGPFTFDEMIGPRVNGVPEPSTWLMMLAAAAAFGALRRRRAVAALRAAATRLAGGARG